MCLFLDFPPSWSPSLVVASLFSSSDQGVAVFKIFSFSPDFLRKPKALAFAAKVSRGGVTSRHFGANVVSGIGKLRVRTLCFLDAWLKSPTQRFVTFPIIRFLVSFAGVGRREYTVFGLLASFLN